MRACKPRLLFRPRPRPGTARARQQWEWPRLSARRCGFLVAALAAARTGNLVVGLSGFPLSTLMSISRRPQHPAGVALRGVRARRGRRTLRQEPNSLLGGRLGDSTPAILLPRFRSNRRDRPDSQTHSPRSGCHTVCCCWQRTIAEPMGPQAIGGRRGGLDVRFTHHLPSVD